MDKTISLSIVAPVYNEELVIEKVVRQWHTFLASSGLSYEIVLTNDGSKDNTGKILSQLSLEIPQLKLISYQHNRGYGYALNLAIKNSRGNFIITIDSDGQFEIKDLKKLIQLNSHFSPDIMVTGYRDKKKDTFIRHLSDKGLNILVRILFNNKLTDTNCALKLIPGDWLRSRKLESVSFSTPTEICLLCQDAGLKIKEIRVNHYPREVGISKLKPFKTMISFFFYLLYLKQRLILKHYRIINI